MSPSSEHPWGPGTPSITEVGSYYQQQEEARQAQRRAQKPRPPGGGKSNLWGFLIVIFIVYVGLKAMVSDDESEEQVQPPAVRPFTGPLQSWERTPESTADDDDVDNVLESLPDSYVRFWTMPDISYNFRFTNNCDHPVRLAIHYLDVNHGWRSEGWWNFTPGESDRLAASGKALRTKNDTWYYYAESTDDSNLVWRGDRTFKLNDRSLPMLLMKDTVGDNNWTITCN